MPQALAGVDDLKGLWWRSLIVDADGARDERTWVAWMQGPSMFADLRMPAARPPFDGVRGPDDLSRVETRWLAGQQGFAGVLERDGDFFAWRRKLDFQPAPPIEDTGSLRFEDDVLVEEGKHIDYVEHWIRGRGPTEPCGAARLKCPDSGRDGFIVRCGTWFMYARSRAKPLPQGGTLEALVDAAESLAAASELLDCEISFGAVAGATWRIERSILPWREGRSLDPQADGRFVLTSGAARDGASSTHRWTILEREGDAEAVPFAASLAATGAAKS